MSFVPGTSSDPDIAVYTRTTDGNQSFVITLSISAACARDGFEGATCEFVAASLEPDAESTCDTNVAPCTCVAVFDDMSPTTATVVAHNGGYATDSGTAEEYCRKGETLEQAQRGTTGNIVSWMRLQKI
jgi:hypothetical protein